MERFTAGAVKTPCFKGKARQDVTRSFLAWLTIGMVIGGIAGTVFDDNLTLGVGFGLSFGIMFYFLFR